MSKHIEGRAKVAAEVIITRHEHGTKEHERKAFKRFLRRCENNIAVEGMTRADLEDMFYLATGKAATYTVCYGCDESAKENIYTSADAVARGLTDTWQSITDICRRAIDWDKASNTLRPWVMIDRERDARRYAPEILREMAQAGDVEEMEIKTCGHVAIRLYRIR